MKNERNFKNGFTLIEILVVIFIIALLLAVTQVSLSSARAKARDITRLSNVRQAQNALELYFYNKNIFPIADNIALGSDARQVLCDSSSGFQPDADGCDKVFLNQLSTAPARTADDSYIYKSSDGQTYSLTFVLEKTADGLGAGRHTATPAGIQ